MYLLSFLGLLYCNWYRSVRIFFNVLFQPIITLLITQHSLMREFSLVGVGQALFLLDIRIIGFLCLYLILPKYVLLEQ